MKMTLKQKIKTYPLTQTELAQLLGVANPTLTYYIRQYEAGKLSKPWIGEVFEQIEKGNLKKTELIKWIYLKRASQNLDAFQKASFKESTLSPLSHQLMEEIKANYQEESLDSETYRFISLCLSQSKENAALRSLMRGFLMANGMIEKNFESTEEEALITQVFDVIQRFENQSLILNPVLSQAFDRKIETKQKEQAPVMDPFMEKVEEHLLKTWNQQNIHPTLETPSTIVDVAKMLICQA